MSNLLTAKEVGEILRVVPSRITRLCDSGLLNYIDLNCGTTKNRSYRFTWEMVNEYIAKASGRPKPNEVLPRYVSKV